MNGMFRISRRRRESGKVADRGKRSPQAAELRGRPPSAGAELLDDRLRLVAQPIVDLRSGEVVAEELLPMIACSSTAPAAASCAGFFERGEARAVDIDTWLVKRASQTAARGRPVHVAVSAASVRSGVFATHVSRAVHMAGADPRNVTVEIDEAFAAQETDEAERFARLVLSTGVQIAINDVALRYPSNDHLARIPAQSIKIDPWLVADVACDHRSAFLVGEIVSLASRYERTTIAEGVDDEELMGVLRAGGVDCAQGYYRQRR